jgi:hypothetical protein
VDDSAVAGKIASKYPGQTADDIPWLKLDMISAHGGGILSGATTVLRVNTKGGAANADPCPTAGAFKSVAYAADYIFLKKPKT